VLDARCGAAKHAAARAHPGSILTLWRHAVDNLRIHLLHVLLQRGWVCGRCLPRHGVLLRQ
jgi:hypothetical protein